MQILAILPGAFIISIILIIKTILVHNSLHISIDLLSIREIWPLLIKFKYTWVIRLLFLQWNLLLLPWHGYLSNECVQFILLFGFLLLFLCLFSNYSLLLMRCLKLLFILGDRLLVVIIK